MQEGDIEVRRIKETINLLTLSSLAGGASIDSSILELADAERLAVTVRCKFHGSATDTITVYGYTSPDNKNYDTNELLSFQPTVSAGATVQKTVYIDPDAEEMYFKITNEDSSNAVYNITITAVKTKVRLSCG